MIEPTRPLIRVANLEVYCGHPARRSAIQSRVQQPPSNTGSPRGGRPPKVGDLGLSGCEPGHNITNDVATATARTGEKDRGILERLGERVRGPRIGERL